MPRGSAVDDVEKKLEREASAKGLKGKKAGSYIYGTLNKIGLKKGSKTTAKGMKPAGAKISAKKAKPAKVAKPPKMVKQIGKPKRKKGME